VEAEVSERAALGVRRALRARAMVEYCVLRMRGSRGCVRDVSLLYERVGGGCSRGSRCAGEVGVVRLAIGEADAAGRLSDEGRCNASWRADYVAVKRPSRACCGLVVSLMIGANWVYGGLEPCALSAEARESFDVNEDPALRSRGNKVWEQSLGRCGGEKAVSGRRTGAAVLLWCC
jgi:hypothetical protein